MSAAADRWARALWLAGWPVRAALLVLIRGYRLTLGKVVGGNCRFHPSCSAYAEAAVSNVGAVRGLALTAWRLLRCSPLTSGGVDLPPDRRFPREPSRGTTSHELERSVA